MATRKELERIWRVLTNTVDLAKDASMTGALEGGSRRCIQQFNHILNWLVETALVPQDLFAPLEEGASLDDAGVACAQLAAYIEGELNGSSEPGEQSQTEVRDIGEAIRRVLPEFLKKDKLTLPSGLRFTERLQRALQVARSEAARLQHDYVGTEHLLLAVIREEGGAAVGILQAEGIDLEKLKQTVDTYTKPPYGVLMAIDQIPITPRAKQALERAVQEAQGAASELVGTRHLLLALAADERGVAAQVLAMIGVSYADLGKHREGAGGPKQESEVDAGAEPKEASGILHIHENGYGFLRPSANAPPSTDDIYVSQRQILDLKLAHGDAIRASARPPKGKEHYDAAIHIERIASGALG